MIGRLGSRRPRTSRAGSRSLRPGVGIEALRRHRAYLEAVVERAADLRDQDVDPVDTCQPLDDTAVDPDVASSRRLIGP